MQQQHKRPFVLLHLLHVANRLSRLRPVSRARCASYG